MHSIIFILSIRGIYTNWLFLAPKATSSVQDLLPRLYYLSQYKKLSMGIVVIIVSFIASLQLGLVVPIILLNFPQFQYSMLLVKLFMYNLRFLLPKVPINIWALTSGYFLSTSTCQNWCTLMCFHPSTWSIFRKDHLDDKWHHPTMNRGVHYYNFSGLQRFFPQTLLRSSNVLELAWATFLRK